MSSSDALPIPRKNAAYRVYFPMLKNDGTILAGWTSPAATISKDGNTSASATNTPTEIASSWGIGYLDLTSTEMNADAVIVKATASNSGALAQVVVLYPQGAGDIVIDLTEPSIEAIVADMDANSTQLARIANKTDLIAVNNVTYSAPVDPVSGDVTLVRGDDYTVSSGRALPSWSSDDWTAFDLTHAESVTFRARSRYGETVFEKTAAVLSSTQVRVELTSAETGDFAVGRDAYDFDLQAILVTGDVVTLAQGQMSVIGDVR